jgi:hypothetical protein
MTTELLKKKTGRYLCGESVPAETMQIQSWLSCTDKKEDIVAVEDRAMIENEIVGQVQAYVISSMFVAEPEPWWKKITAFF